MASAVLVLAQECGAREPMAVPAERLGHGGISGEPWSLLFVDLPNDSVGRFVAGVREVSDDALCVLLPVGSLPLNPPLDTLHDEVGDVSRLSTLELVASSLQSVGSWRGVAGYSVLAGVIGACGLIFDVPWLLVAAMLINPMGAPLLVAVTGIAIGDARLFGRGGLRFLVALVVQAFAALAVGLLYDLRVSTATMEQVTSLSALALLVALAAGAAGAKAQIRSERDSLVSGTAAGFMVAAALAPPAATLGLAVALQRWDYTGIMAFLLALQFLAISAAGWTVLYSYGVAPGDAGVGRGGRTMRAVLAGTVLIATAALALGQRSLEPSFLRADLSRAALEVAQEAVDGTDGVFFIESSARFTRQSLARYQGETLLFAIVVERAAGAGNDDALAAQVRERVRHLVAERMHRVVPLVDVRVLPGPGR